MSQNQAAPARTRIHQRVAFRGHAGRSLPLPDAARITRDDLPVVTRKDHRVLTDVGRGRYAFLADWVDMARRCKTDRAAFALIEDLTAAIWAVRPRAFQSVADAARETIEAERAAQLATSDYAFAPDWPHARFAAECVHAAAISHDRLYCAFMKQQVTS